MVHDPSVRKWRVKNTIKFTDDYVTLDTIKLSSGNFQSVLFRTDGIGRLKDLGIKAIKKHDDETDAVAWHNKAFTILNDLAVSNSVMQAIDYIIKSNFMQKNDGPFEVRFDEVKDGNTVVGRDLNNLK